MPNKRKQDELESPRGELLVYQGQDGGMKLEVRLQNETIWLTVNQMAELFGVDKSGISRHLKNIYKSGELQREATVAKYATVQNEGEQELKQIESLVKQKPSIRDQKHEDS